MSDDLVLRIGNSTRVEESQIRSFKWASDKDDHEAFLYANIINFKRSSNPRGHAHHCVMCGDRKAAIPSQNKDVCKTCDSGYWLVESVQVVVKFCKGCKNFTRLHDFRDKPEATKCIKCRQRGRQNYFAKKGRGDLVTLLPQAKGGASDLNDIDPHMHVPTVSSSRGPMGTNNSNRTTEYGEYYLDEHIGVGPRVTSSRQKSLQQNRMNKKQSGMSVGRAKNGRGGQLYTSNHGGYIVDDGYDHIPLAMTNGRPHDHDRASSFSSLLNGNYGGDDSSNLLNLGDTDDGLGRQRSDTLLSISSVGLAGLGESLGVHAPGKGSGSGSGSGSGGKPRRSRVGSDDWDYPPNNGNQFGLLDQDMFDNEVPTFMNGNIGSGSGGGSGSASASAIASSSTGGKGSSDIKSSNNNSNSNSSNNSNSNNNNSDDVKREENGGNVDDEPSSTSRKRRGSITDRSGSGKVSNKDESSGNASGEHGSDSSKRMRRDTLDSLREVMAD
jgi:hypothetical protein